MPRMPIRPVLFTALAAMHLLGCKVYDPLYCDNEKRCDDPARPFCDMDGIYPGSEGIKRTCIADPNIGVDGATPLADASSGEAGIDASGPRRIVQVSAGSSHTCVVLNDGGLRCWGRSEALGYPSTESIGDDEHPYEAGDVPTAGKIRQVSAGNDFTCALYETGNIRCWGDNFFGELGYGHSDDLTGPKNTPDMLPDVEVGGPVMQIVTGFFHTCALLESGDVRCWGGNTDYQLATGDRESIGDNEVPGSRSPVALGGTALAISAGGYHTCALMEGGFVRCWGSLESTSGVGPLGYGGIEPVGDDETPASEGNIDIGGSAVAISTGREHVCALLSGGRVRCWGRGARPGGCGAALGYQEEQDIGDDETPASAGNVDVGGEVAELVSAATARCARLTSGAVRCWGASSQGSSGPCVNSGVLGHGNDQPIGDDETPASAGDLRLGGVATRLSDGGSYEHVCALLDDGGLRCWGRNVYGQLGLGHTNPIGDDEEPADVDPVRVLE